MTQDHRGLTTPSKLRFHIGCFSLFWMYSFIPVLESQDFLNLWIDVSYHFGKFLVIISSNYAFFFKPYFLSLLLGLHLKSFRLSFT